MSFRNTSLRTAMLVGVFFCGAIAHGQEDAVYRFREGGGNSKVSGKISGMTPSGLTVESSSGAKEVPAAEISKLVFAGEPAEISRARDRI